MGTSESYEQVRQYLYMVTCSLMSQQEKENFGRNTTPSSETCCHGSFMVKEVLAVVTIGLANFGHVYVGLGWTYKPMVGVTEGDPAAVVGAATVRDGTAEHRVRFHTEVALAVGARRFVVPPDLTVVTERDFVADPCIVRR